MTALAWISTICLLGGTVAVAMRMTGGWLVRLAGSSGWFIWAMYSENWPLAICNSAFVLVDVMGLLTWDAQDTDKEGK
jgi:hypothetical protein